jgi:zinc/manganese transport system substrate-binding protein
MKKIFFTIIFMLMAALPAFANVNVITSYPYIQDIAQRIGKNRINVSALANGNWDPHFVVPKPSLIAKARKADLLIINGGQLEIGWLPQVIRQSSNSSIQTGARGLLDLSAGIKMIELPASVSRSLGDVHPQGNPHFVLDPYNVPLISKAIADRLSQIDPANKAFYAENNSEFTKSWLTREKGWDSKMKSLRGTKVIEYHRLYDYLFNRFGLVYAGALEPLPGIPPSPKHLIDIIQTIKSEKVRFIFQDVYHPKDPAEFVAGKTGVRIVVIPQDVNAVSGAKDIFSLFDYIVSELTR